MHKNEGGDGAGVASSSMLYLALSLLMGVAVKFLRPPLWLTTLVFERQPAGWKIISDHSS